MLKTAAESYAFDAQKACFRWIKAMLLCDKSIALIKTETAGFFGKRNNTLTINNLRTLANLGRFSDRGQKILKRRPSRESFRQSELLKNLKKQLYNKV